MNTDAPAGQPLRAQDAFFVHDATPLVARQLGAVLLLEDSASTVPLERLGAHIAQLIRDRAPRLPMLSRQLQERPGEWPRWLPVERVSGDEHLGVHTIGAFEAPGAGCSRAVDEFFGTPLATDRPPWLLHLVRDAATGQTAVLAKMHHALGDGVAMTDTLIRLLSDAEPAAASAGSGRPAARPGLRRRLVRAGMVLRGLGTLAPVGLAPVRGLEGARSSRRHYATLELPAAKVRSVAREFGSSTSAVLLTVVAEALHRMRPEHGDALHGQQLRVMVPRSTRTTRTGTDGGNWTAAVSLDLPVGPMSPAQRLTEVATRLTTLDGSGQPAAIAAVLGGLRRLPARLQTKLVGMISRGRFFDLIVSVMPGSRRVHRVSGCRIAAVFPILPLGRVGLAVGMISWADVVGVGVTADADVLEDTEDIADCLRAAFDDLCTDRPPSWAAAG